MDNKKKIGIASLAIAGVAALGIGGAAVAGTAGFGDDTDKPLTGSTLDRASSAAVDAVGGGDVTTAETNDDRGSAYEVEVRRADGSEIDVHLDNDFNVVRQDVEAEDRDDADQPLTGAVLEDASAAALTAAGGGTVTDAERSDDPGIAYDVEVTKADGTEVDVHLDKDFNIVRQETEAADQDDD